MPTTKPKKKTTTQKVANAEEQVEDKVLEKMDAKRYTRTHMLLVVLVALFIPSSAWVVLGDLTGGKLTKPKTEDDVVLECVRRAVDKDDLDDAAFRTAVEACVPKKADG